jgi:hypothetical protein
MWQISNLSEGASIFTNGFSIPSNGSDAGWTNQSNMSANGKYIYEKFTSYAQSADWRNNPPPVSSSSLDVSSSSSSENNQSSSSSSSSNRSSSSSSGGQSSSSNDVSSIAIGNTIVLENLPKNTKIEVYNLKGKLVYSQFSTLNSQFIPVQAKGLYIVKIRHENSSSEVTKLLISR